LADRSATLEEFVRTLNSQKSTRGASADVHNHDRGRQEAGKARRRQKKESTEKAKSVKMRPEPRHKTKTKIALTKVFVTVPFKSAVEYEVDVEDPHDLKEIKRALGEKDPSDWRDDPCFYEWFGFGWRKSVRKLRLKDVCQLA